MSTEGPDWTQVQQDVQLLLERFRTSIPEDAFEHINQLNAHDEYEMAFEGLCIQLIEGSLVSENEYLEMVRLGRILALDKETVYREDFWELLMMEGDRLGGG